MIKPSVALAALALLALPAVAQAAEGSSSDAPDAGRLFTQLDANQDGQLTTDEIPDDRKSLFGRLLRIGDKNNDGKLDADEFAAGLTGRHERPDAPSRTQRSERSNRDERAGRGKLFERLDANGDGKIVLDEVPEAGRERFEKLIARIDKDGDGAVTRREFAAAAPAAGDAARNRHQAGRDGSHFFKQMDKNADGKLTADEVPEERRPMFERLIERGDKDGDQTLSLEEFTAVFGRRRPGSPPATAEAKRKKTAQAAARGRLPPGLFGAIDADGDGQLDRAEIAAAAQAIRKLDKDGDGTVTEREIRAGAARRKKQKNQ